MGSGLTPTTIFALGLIGALAPEIVRLYSIRSDSSKFKWSHFYVVVSFLFALLGGVIALVLPATTAWAALYAGISAPTIVTVAAKRAAPKKRQLKGAEAKLSYFQSFIEGL
jgi:hypothetical protein